MIIRIFGITTPSGEYLYERFLKKNYKNIYCYSRKNKYIYLDLKKEQKIIFKNEKKQPEIWISFSPIWLFAKFIIKLNKDEKNSIKYLKKIIIISSSSVISKKFSWHEYDKYLVNRILKAEESLSNLSREKNFSLTILRPTLIFGKSLSYKDKNISKLNRICKFMPLIVFPKNSGKRQPISIHQLASVIYYLLVNTQYKKNFIETINLGGDETLTYEDLIRTIIKKNKYNCKILLIPKIVFLFILSPLILFNSRSYSQIIRIFSNLSGFTKSSKILFKKNQKFSKYLYR